MKSRFRATTAILPLIIALGGITAATAATWTGDTNASWATSNNWSGTAPDNTTPQAIVFDSNSDANLSQTLNASYGITGITLTSPTGTVSVTNGTGTGNTLTIGSGGIDMSQAAQNLTVGANTAIGTNQTWTVAGGRTLTGIAGSTTSVGTGTGNIVMSRSSIPGFDSGTATIVFNQNGNGTGWGGYSGNITVNSNVKVQSQGNAAAAFGSGTVTLAGGEIAQNSGNWTWSNNISVTAASVIASDSGTNSAGRSLKLLGDLGSSNSSGLTFTMRNNTAVNDANGFILAGANASTYGTTTISANTKVRVGGESTTSLTGTGFNPGTRGSLGTGDVTLSAATSQLQFTRIDAHNVSNKITGSGTVVIGGSGTGTIGSTTWNMSGTSTQVVTLSGTSDYTGATTVKNGRLNLTGSLTSAVTVNNGGAISGTGTTTGSLTLATGGNMVLAGGATTNSFTVNGAAFNGSNVVTFLTEATPNTVYDVFTYGAGAVTNPGNLTVAWRGTLSDDTANKKYIFTAGNVGSRTWNTTSGTWTVGTAGNWTGGDNLYYNGDTAVFNNPSSDSTVTLSGIIKPGAVNLNHTNAYIFTGSAIEGTGALSKSGSGILTLTSANTYSGGTTLNAGTIRIGNDSALGTGTLAVNGGVLSSDSGSTRSLANDMVLGGDVQLGDGTNGGLLVMTGDVDLGGGTRSFDSRLGSGQGARFDGVISNGGFTLNGAGSGIVTLNGSNTFTSATTVTSGYLAIGNNALTNSASVSLAAGTRLYVGVNGTTNINNLSGASTATLRSDFTITGTSSARTLQVTQTTDGTFEGSFAEGGSRPISLIKEGAATLTLTGTGTYTGTTTVNAGTMKIGGAGLLGGGSYAGNITNDATLHFDSTATQTLSGTVSGSGTLLKSNTGTLILTNNNSYAGAITISGGTLQLGNNTTAGFIGNSATVTNNAALVWHRSNDTNVGNAISGTGTLTKLGSAKLTLNGNSDYTGATTVSGGTLVINGNISTSTLTTVESGATIGGSGTVGALSVLAGGILAPGTSPGTLTTGTLTLADTSISAFELNPSDTTVGLNINDLVSVTGSLTLDGILNVVATSGDFLSVIEGASWRLFNYSGSLTDNTLTLGTMPALGTGLGWSVNTSTAGEVNLVVIPEPGAALLGGLGLICLLRRRR